MSDLRLKIIPTPTLKAKLLQGPAGPAGLPGAQGVQGIQGIQGPQGDVGPPGIQGPDGAAGPAGPAGPAGAAGSVGTQFQFATSTADSDPGSGAFRFNNATPSLVTAIYVDNNEFNGTSVTAWLDSFDDAGDATDRGNLRIINPEIASDFYIFKVTGSVVDGTGYRKITVVYISGQGTFAAATPCSFAFFMRGSPGVQGPPGLSVLTDGDYGDIIVSGVGTAINIDSSVLTAAGRAIIDDADAPAQRATLGLVIGTNVQAQDAELAAIAGLTSAVDRLPYFTGLGTASLATFTAAGRAIIDDADATAQLATLGAVAYTAQTLTAAQQQIARTNLGAPLKGHIFGLTLSNNGADAANDIDIAVGQCASTETNPVLLVLVSAITKRLDAAWSVGTNQGGLDTGAKAVSTWYYIWVIRRSDTGVTDALFSLSSTAPTMPTNYDQKRRIGAVRTDGSGNILAFSQSSDEFLLSTAIGDVNAVQGTTAVLYTLTVPPIGGVRVKFNIGATGAAGLNPLMLVSSPDQADQTVNSPVGNGTVYSPVVATSNFLGSSPVRTVSGQVRIRAANAGGNIYIATFGWTDERGQYGNP